MFQLNYTTYPPCPSLSRYIKCYWTLESNEMPAALSRERVFPDGCIELIFHFGDLFKKYKPDNNAELQPRSFIHGQLKEFMELEATGNIGVLSVRFHPNGLWPFIDCGIHELTDQHISVMDIWNKEGAELEDRIMNASSTKQRIAVLESFLLKKLARSFKEDKLVDHCVNTILQSDGNISIETLANDLRIGTRHLERKFISSVGLSPKMLSRITRFQNTLNLIDRRQFTSLTVVAYEGGFYDQAHFIKDFRDFTGLNPRQYFSEDLALVKYFNL